MVRSENKPNNAIHDLKSDWEDLGELDPLFAISSVPGKRFGKWDPVEFLESGKSNVALIMDEAARLGFPKNRENALDFGCGAGRLTIALSEHFDQCYGVDISEAMIALATKLTPHDANCKFVVNTLPDLSIFSDSFFSLVYSYIVLQHMPTREMIFGYLTEFFRVLAPNGLLVFQLTSYIPALYRLQPTRRLYWLLRKLGVSKNFIYNQLKLQPIRMQFIPQEQVIRFLEDRGAIILHVQTKNSNALRSSTYFVSK